MCNLLKLIQTILILSISLKGNDSKLTDTQQNIYTEQDIGEFLQFFSINYMKLQEISESEKYGAII